MSEVNARLLIALAGRYAIERELGSGGMATVYLAHDVKHDRDVALKVLRPELAASIGAQRFLAEIRLTARLQHANIVPLFDSGEADGFIYYVMPYIEGESLRTRLVREQRLDLNATLAIARPVAQALACAHELGVVHRDIKPENILLSRGQPFVTDFGIALAVTAAGGQRLTATGLAIGTPAYMSPEQALGEPTVDLRSDVYSLGCVIYELLMGEPPFRGPTAHAVIARRLAGPPPHLTRTSAAVDDVVRKALAAEPQDRFASATALADALLEAAGRPAMPEKSIVVLPFENLSPDPDNAFFADGLTEEVIATLTKVRALRVISRTSAMLLRGSSKSVPTIARELNVSFVLEGSIRRAGNSLRITAQLIDGSTDAHLWAERYAGTMHDVFDLQERLARSIVDALAVTLAPEEDRRLRARTTNDPRAYEAWLRAMHESRRYTREGAERALKLVRQALASVGDDALLYAAQGYIHYVRYDYWFSHNDATLADAEAASSKALTLDPELSQAALSMALVCFKRGDSRGFARFAKRAVDLERNADSLLWWGYALAMAGRSPEARVVSNEAVARDPFSFPPVCYGAMTDIFDGRCEEGYERIRGAVETIAADNPFAVWWLGQSAAYAGHDERAKAALARVETMGEQIFARWAEVMRKALEGDRAGVREAIDRAGLRDVARTDEYIPCYLAACLAWVGETGEALDWIEQAIRWGSVAHRFYEVNRFFAPLTGHPRFRTLMELARKEEAAFEA